MGFTKRCTLVLILLPASSFAGFEYVKINTHAGIPIGKQCPGNTETLKLSEGVITITPKTGSAYNLNLDEPPENSELIIARSYPASNCSLAIKYAENNVNESFSLSVYSPTNKKFIPSQINTITNPDFLEGKILSSYRDAALLHNDTLCFSERLNDYFICEKMEQFNSALERFEKCDERSCSNSEIVKIGTRQPIVRVVKIKKVFLFDRVGEEHFSQRKGYLIKNDKVSLHDYFQSREALFYKITFFGKKPITGWVRSEAIDI